MPSFVPVTDTEKPKTEQSFYEARFIEHRRFDAPHSLVSNNQQLSIPRDEQAQYLRHADGENKMIKNEKGLWIKSKANGNSVEGGNFSRNESEERSNREAPKHRESPSRSRSKDRSFTRDRSDSRSRKRRFSKRDDSRERKDYRRRSRSNSPRRHRSRSRTSRRHRSRSRSDSRRYSKISRSPNSRDRKYYRDDKEKNKYKDKRHHRSRSSSHDSFHKKEDKFIDKKIDSNDHLNQDSIPQISITVIQVLNRFHEVYAFKPKNPELRLDFIQDLFAENAIIGSLKSESIYLTGKEEIRISFKITQPTEVLVSKRIYIEAKELKYTWSFDLHRCGTSPGLGDPTKCTALLYMSNNALFERIWGTVDLEKLSDQSELTKDQVIGSKLWKLALKIISQFEKIERKDIKEEFLHYHNYDHMEVWG